MQKAYEQAQKSLSDSSRALSEAQADNRKLDAQVNSINQDILQLELENEKLKSLPPQIDESAITER